MDGPAYTTNNEGSRLVSYLDSEGYYTIGIGHCLGRGSEFANVVWFQARVAQQFAQDYNEAVNNACTDVGDVCWGSLNEVRKAILTDMAFQLGKDGLADFKRMIAAILVEDWTTAASEMLASDYADQAQKRAKQNASILVMGTWPYGV